MRHDPERDAAAYLADELGMFAWLRFERHMLDCDDCWQEASTARQGRMLAESLREVAPPATRERIRAVADRVEVQTSPRMRRPYQISVPGLLAQTADRTPRPAPAAGRGGGSSPFW